MSPLPELSLPEFEVPPIDEEAIATSFKAVLPPAEYGGFKGPAGAVVVALGLSSVAAERERERLQEELDKVTTEAAEAEAALKLQLAEQTKKAQLISSRVVAAEEAGEAGARLQRALRRRMQAAEDRLRKIDGPGEKIDAEMARKEAELFMRYNATASQREAELASLPAQKKSLSAEVASLDREIRELEPQVRVVKISEGLGPFLDMRQLQASLKALVAKRDAKAAALSALGGRATELNAELKAARVAYRAETDEALGKLRARRAAFDESVAEQVYDVSLGMAELEALEEELRRASKQ